jgi:hypothetical protein
MVVVVVVVFVDEVCHDDRVYKRHIKCEEEVFFSKSCVFLLLIHFCSLTTHRSLIANQSLCRVFIAHKPCNADAVTRLNQQIKKQ